MVAGDIVRNVWPLRSREGGINVFTAQDFAALHYAQRKDNPRRARCRSLPAPKGFRKEMRLGPTLVMKPTLAFQERPGFVR